MKKETICVQAGYESKNGEPRVLPIYQSTTYSYDSSEELAKLFDLSKEGHMYSRISNPTVECVEKKVAALEGGVGAMMTSGWFSVFLYIFAYLLIGYKVILKALKNLGRKDFLDENFLMCLATFGAIALQDYGEAIAVMMFYAIGEIFQGYAVNKTRNSISSLMNVKSDYANLQHIENISTGDNTGNNDQNAVIVKVKEQGDDDYEYEGYYMTDDRKTLYIVEEDSQSSAKSKLEKLIKDVKEGRANNHKDKKYLLSIQAR